MWLMSNFEAAAFVVIVALMVAMAVIVSIEPLGRRAAQNVNHWRAITSLGYRCSANVALLGIREPGHEN